MTPQPAPGRGGVCTGLGTATERPDRAFIMVPLWGSVYTWALLKHLVNTGQATFTYRSMYEYLKVDPQRVQDAILRAERHGIVHYDKARRIEARRLGEYVYYTFIANINGVKIEGGNYDPKKVPEKIDEIIDRLSKRTKALSVIRSPTVAEGLVNEAIEDIAMLIALLRAMVLEIKASIVKA